MNLSASLVLYRNDPKKFVPAIESYIDGSEGFLVIIDNSEVKLDDIIFRHKRVKYIHVGKNIGFGAGHNMAFEYVANKSDVHLFMNPDVYFENNVLSQLLEVLKKEDKIMALMPKIQYESGELQRLCKLLPTPADLILRRFIPIKKLKEKNNRRYELYYMPQNEIIDVPSLSGCFLVARTNVLRKIDCFDEKYFMYMEDVDLVRRIADYGRVVYYPMVTVTHLYEKGSYFNIKLLAYHTISAIKYFNKWGWFIDKERKRRNNKILSEIDLRKSKNHL